MRIGILGTGVVGQTLGGKLVRLGHDVRMGSRKMILPFWLRVYMTLNSENFNFYIAR